MPGIKISALAAVPSAQITDIFPVVQSGVTYKETLGQLLTLFNANISISESQVTNLVADLAAKLNLSGGTMSGAIDMANHFITNLLDPVNPQDAATRAFVLSTTGAFLPLSGGTMSGVINMGNHKITNLTDPTNAQDAATKFYVDSVATGLNIQGACYAASTANLNATYLNGAAGINATLTNAGAMAAFSIDGVSPPLNSRILVKDQSSTLENGIYTLTTVGSGAVNWVLTRATDYDQPSEISPGDLVIINNGTVNATTSWLETVSVSAVGTDPILFSQFTFAPSAFLLKANNLSDVASTTTSFNNISPLTTKGDILAYSTTNTRLAVGGTDGQILGVSSGAPTGIAWSTPTYPMVSATSGKFIISDGTNFVPSTSTIPSSAGATANKVLLSDGTNYILSTPTFPNASATSGKIIISDGTNWIASTPTFPATAGASGNVMTSDGTNWISSASTGSGTVSSGTTNQLAYYAANGTTVSGLATALNGVLVTDGSGVPSISSTIPAFITSSITFSPTTGGIVGTTTNNNAAAGKVGEVISSAVLFASGVSLSTITSTNITSISLTAGDWDVYGFFRVDFTVNAVEIYGWTSTTSATLPDASLRAGIGGTGIGPYGGAITPQRLSLSATTTVYLSTYANFSSGTATASGLLWARRAR